MIFVTVGTHEQQFNRLVQYVDRWKKECVIEEEVVIQTGFSTYEPKNCRWKKMFPYREMMDLVKTARIVITHGGPSSIMPVLQEAKIPIVVPRQKKYDEHVNDHQVEFARFIRERQGNIIVVEEIEELKEKIEQYDRIVQDLPARLNSNNAVFNEKLEEIVTKLFSQRGKRG